MLLSHTKRLCMILPSLIVATPQDTTPVSTSLPDILQRNVPACAQPCLLASVNKQFPLVCTAQVNLTCLCSRYSISGNALGEVALECIYTSCSTIEQGAAASAYNVCLGERGAVRPTKTALTIALTSSPPSTIMESSKISVSTTSAPSLTSSSRSQLSPTETVAIDSISLIPSSTSSLPATTSAPIAFEDPPKTMKPAQIAGLSVAAAATFLIAIGLMALSVFLRRRRERKEIFEIPEKGTHSPAPRNYSAQFSQYFAPESLPTEPPKQFPIAPAPALQKHGRSSRSLADDVSMPNRHSKQIYPRMSRGPKYPQKEPADFSSIHPLLRSGPEASNNSSRSSIPLEQIGLAISAEEQGDTDIIARSSRSSRSSPEKRPSQRGMKQTLSLQRPDSVVTQDTVFEEDDVSVRRRSSKLLPTPPIPIPPIRSLQSSNRPPVSKLNNRILAQQRELFLDIPVRHQRPASKVIVPVELSSESPPQVEKPPQGPRLDPPFEETSEKDIRKPISTASSTNGSSLTEDIPDYYFTAHQEPSPNASALRMRSVSRSRSNKSPKLVQVKARKTIGTGSRANSQASTNIRDSISSQTSFETVDPNDPTPEDEDEDKQLSDDNKLSPVAESPIYNLRYPKVPRSSNQLIPRSSYSPLSPRSPRSPRSPQDNNRQESSTELPEPSSLLVKRRGEREALQLESRLQMTNSSNGDPQGRIRPMRHHLRSNSVETWSTDPTPHASTRTQSGQFPKSPAMYDFDAVRPLNVRPREHQQSVDVSALKSPAWVPRLTPTRQGDDLLISVTYSKSGQ